MQRVAITQNEELLWIQRTLSFHRAIALLKRCCQNWNIICAIIRFSSDDAEVVQMAAVATVESHEFVVGWQLKLNGSVAATPADMNPERQINAQSDGTK